MANIAIVKSAVSNAAIIRAHMSRHGSISTRDGALFYGMTGGTLTKEISNLRRFSNIIINKNWIKDSVTGRRFAQYRLTYGDIIPAFALAYIAKA